MSFLGLAGKYADAFGAMGGMSFDPTPGFNLDYTTKPPLGGDSTLPSSPEGPKAGGFNIGGIQLDSSKLSEDSLLALGMYRDQNDPQKQLELLKAYDEIQTRQADKMMKYGLTANIAGSLLKDIPRAITAAALPPPGYYERLAEMGQAPRTVAQAMPLGGAASGPFGSGRSGYFRGV